MTQVGEPPNLAAPTAAAAAPAVEESAAPAAPMPVAVPRFWHAGAMLRHIDIRIDPPDEVLEILEKLGSSPFPRGGFPLVGFLASTYDRVSRYALDRAASLPAPPTPQPGESVTDAQA